MFKLSKLKTKHRNPRKIDEARLAQLQKSVTEFSKMLSVRPIVYHPTTFEVIGGNQRLRALLAVGIKEVPNEYVRPATDFTEEEIKRFILVDNEQFGAWDKDILFQDYEVEELEDWGVEVLPEYKTDVNLDDFFEEDTEGKNKIPKLKIVYKKLNPQMLFMNLNVSEIFYSIQGEGARAGTPTVFVRLQGCKAKHACAAMGIVCDTEFESGKAMSVESIVQWIKDNAQDCKEITWTGGEPLDQLTPECISYFKNCGYYQAIETSGLHPIPDGLDFVCVSPKVAEHIVKKNIPLGVTELRYVRHKGQAIPNPSIKANHYWLSPHSDGYTINTENLKHCIELCLQNPQWKISVQQHKLWNIL